MLSYIIILTSLINTIFSNIVCPIDALNECHLTGNGMPNENIIITDKFTRGKVACTASNGPGSCKLSNMIIASQTFLIQCIATSSCEGSTIQSGIPAVIPPGFTIDDFDNVGSSGSCDFDGENSCNGCIVEVNGNYPGGVQVNARGINSFNGGTFVCDLLRGQECRLICIGNACLQSNFLCNSCNCDCTGISCPDIILGRNCPRSPNLNGDNVKFPGMDFCRPDIPRPNECLDAPFIKFDIDGFVECVEVADCCTCERIECNMCNEVKCDGERSCIGVPILIDGADGGASLACNLPQSCRLAHVTGNNVNMVRCGADRSCESATFLLNLDRPASSLSIDCGGIDSCEMSTINANNVEMLICGGNDACRNSNIDVSGLISGMSLDCSGNEACRDSTIIASNVAEWFCTGNFACFGTSLSFNCLTAGCALQCTGVQSCRDTTLSITNINIIECGGTGAGCFSSVFDLDCVSEGCAINCNNQDACRRSAFNITNTNGLNCMGSFSCAASNFTFENNVNGGLTCMGQSACRDVRINSLENLNKFDCISFRACRDSTIISTCNSNQGCQLQCNGPESCFNANIITTNSNEVTCSDDRACANIMLHTTLLNDLYIINCNTLLTCNNANIKTVITNPSITSIQGIRCTATEACIDATFTFDASSLDNPVIIDSIVCEGVRACQQVTYNLINVIISEINIQCIGLAPCDPIINIRCFNATNSPSNDCIV